MPKPLPPIDWDILRKKYPTWRIRPTAEGTSLMATRWDRFGLTDAELVAGLHMTLIEDTPDELTAALTAQHAIEDTL
ncbi:hypothetical protein EDD29_0535 [Actinocorallia herbida]|uniref:Uncharacterized protein n=1 Tax=Actinocorallia herbida TaxID=58109 RepID=A0A3N1CNZ7_9ACTN|nr:hypothetical protein [Actinocorallia herbida]ROO83046.1 hypothetical protein EDD29_0535 [Actinocorallia herbida]